MCVCVKPVITYGYFTISYNEARKTICGDNKNWILIQTCRGLECESEVSSQRRRFWCHSDINLGRWVDVPAMLVRTFAQAVLLPCFWVLWQESIARISPFATVPHRRWLRKSGDGKFYSHHHQINLSSVWNPLAVMRERINKCQIQQGAVTEFVGSLPTKTPAFSGDALGDVLMCTCKTN